MLYVYYIYISTNVLQQTIKLCLTHYQYWYKKLKSVHKKRQNQLPNERKRKKNQEEMKETHNDI